MDITEDQTPPDLNPPAPDRGVPPVEGPDTGSKPDLIHPERPDKEIEPEDPSPDMDPRRESPDDDELH